MPGSELWKENAMAVFKANLPLLFPHHEMPSQSIDTNIGGHVR